MESAISESSTPVIWESGTFDATSVRLTAQRLGLRTDASTRYEKSLDPLLAGKTFSRVCEYLDFCKKDYEILGQYSYLDRTQIQKRTIRVPFALITSQAGIPIHKERIFSILDGLGFAIRHEDDEIFEVEVPSWRATKDITIAEDISEEILRVMGYDAFPPQHLQGDISLQEKNHEKEFYDRINMYFATRGWNEVYNYSFTNQDLEKKSLSPISDAYISVLNAYTEEFTHMRMSLAAHLFANIRDNIKYRSELSFFEMGKVYGKGLAHSQKIASLLEKQSSTPYPERKMVAGITTARSLTDLRRDIELLFERMFGYIPPVLQGTQRMVPYLHPGASGSYRVDSDELVIFGKIHPSVAENFEIPEETWYFEMDFEKFLLRVLERERLFQPISAYQSIPRELNFILPEHTETGEIARDIEAIHPWISRVTIDSVYRDEEKIGSEKKSVNFAFVLQSMDGTISDTEALDIQNSIIEKMKASGYSLRGF